MGMNDIPIDIDNLVMEIKIFRKNLKEKFLGVGNEKIKAIDDMLELSIEIGIITTLMYLNMRGYIILKKVKQNEPN